MALTDTSEADRQRQIAVYATTPGADKVLLASEMAEQAKQIAFDGIRARNPGFSERDVHVSWLQILHGELTSSLTSNHSAEAGATRTSRQGREALDAAGIKHPVTGSFARTFHGEPHMSQDIRSLFGHPIDDCGADLVGAVLLDEVTAGDRDLSLIWERAGEVKI